MKIATFVFEGKQSWGLVIENPADGHGYGTSLCEITGGIPEDGVFRVTVTYFADSMKSVAVRTDEYELVKIGGGICKYKI